jgi:LysM repeat protein
MSRNLSIVQRILFLLFFVLLPSLIGAQQQEYKDYMIEKGDTLWNISNKELKDPFLWPKVWKENPGIKNPDLIYPKQKIKIPLYLLQKEIVPETKVEPRVEIKPLIRPRIKPETIIQKPVARRIAPVKQEYLVNKDILIASGYIAESVHSVGKMTDFEPGKTILAKGDYAFIKTAKPVKKGDKFYITRSAETIKHPKTNKKIGYLVEILGIAEVAETDDPKVVIIDSYVEIPLGSLLDNFYEIEPLLAIENPRKPAVNGYIIATRQLHLVNGNWDIIYIDKGKNYGLKVGDILATTLQNQHKIYNGLIQIIKIGETTSTTIVRKSNVETTIGDGVTGAMWE